MLAEADFLTVHVPLTAANHHLLDDAAFAKMKAGVRVLNVARGELGLATLEGELRGFGAIPGDGARAQPQGSRTRGIRQTLIQVRQDPEHAQVITGRSEQRLELDACVFGTCQPLLEHHGSVQMNAAHVFDHGRQSRASRQDFDEGFEIAAAFGVWLLFIRLLGLQLPRGVLAGTGLV